MQAVVNIRVIFQGFEVRDDLGRHAQLFREALFESCGEGVGDAD